MYHRTKKTAKSAVLRQAINELLADLGGDPKTVASTLVAAGVRGVRTDVRNCALASYLNAIVLADPRVQGVVVKSKVAVIERTGWWRRPVTILLPLSVRQFVTAFDAYEFPELVRPATNTTNDPDAVPSK